MQYISNLNWGIKRKLELIRQTESAECGIACLAMIADWHGYRTNLAHLRTNFGVTLHGISLARLIECAGLLKLSGRAVSLELNELCQLTLPCILHWNLNHFVVLKKVTRNQIEIHDPAIGAVCMPMSEVSNHFTGVALELTPSHDFEKKDLRKKVKLSSLIGKTVGLKSALFRIFFFAFVLELLVLAGPLMNQLVIDEVLVGLDDDLLSLVIIAMLLLAASQTVISLVRQWATITMSVNFNMQWTANIFHHLLRLPIDWYEKRNMGGICARFDSINTIQHTLTTSTLQALLDAILVISTFTMMMFYNTKLSAIAVLSATIYGALRFFWFGTIRQAQEDSWVANTEESSHFLETMRGIVSLRVNNTLPWRESAWMNLNVTRRNKQLKEDKLYMIYDTANTLIGSLVSAAILWFGAKTVISGEFTIGMLVAFMSFQSRFSMSTYSLIDKIFEYRMLDLYNERLADIVLTPKSDFSFEHLSLDTKNLNDDSASSSSPALNVDNLSFSYGKGENEILSNISFKVDQNEVVALIGPSGCGKTTLVKLLLGLYKPNKGEVTILGVNSSNPSFCSIGKKIGTVLQDDELFSGSLFDNITFFSSEADLSRVKYCAKLAEIHEYIESLPMGYQTLVGEMGSSISGGQKQRLLLARALYKTPKLLILDEATSHLDIENELAISKTIKKLNLPVLLIAHRPETIKSADRIVELGFKKINHNLM